MAEWFLSAIECTWVNNVRLTETHTAESLVPVSSDSEVEIAIEKRVSYNKIITFIFHHVLIGFVMLQIYCVSGARVHCTLNFSLFLNDV
jgi:hypothetical protein